MGWNKLNISIINLFTGKKRIRKYGKINYKGNRKLFKKSSILFRI